MNAEIFGEVISWDMEGAIITHHDVRQALEDAGLNPDESPELTNQQAFGRACKDLKKERAIDKLKIDGGIAKFQLTRKVKNEGTGTLDYDYEAIVELDCQTGNVSCPESVVIQTQAQELLAHAMQMRTTADVTRLVKRLFAKHADLFPLNSKGCAYFAPLQHRDFTERVEKFMNALGGKLQRFPVPKGTAQGNASVKDAVQGGLAVMLHELNAAVDGWDEGVRKGTIERQFNKYQQLQYKVDAYAIYLESAQAELREQLAAAQDRLRAKISAEPQDTAA